MSPPTTPPAAAAASPRLFIALWPTTALRRALEVEQGRWQWPRGAVLTAPDKLHLTLHFLGAVPLDRIAPLAAALQALRCERSVLLLDRAEVWPNRCALLGTSVMPPALATLHAAIGDALRALELPVEARRFSPHVTLARKAAGATPPAEPVPLRWPVRGFALVRSSGGRYETLARFATADA